MNRYLWTYKVPITTFFNWETSGRLNLFCYTFLGRCWYWTAHTRIRRPSSKVHFVAKHEMHFPVLSESNTISATKASFARLPRHLWRRCWIRPENRLWPFWGSFCETVRLWHRTLVVFIGVVCRVGYGGLQDRALEGLQTCMLQSFLVGVFEDLIHILYIYYICTYE